MKIITIIFYFLFGSAILFSQTTCPYSGIVFEYSACGVGPCTSTTPSSAYSSPAAFSTTLFTSDYGPRYVGPARPHDWHGGLDLHGAGNDLGYYLHAPVSTSMMQVHFVGSIGGPNSGFACGSNSYPAMEGLKQVVFSVGSEKFSFIHLFRDKSYEFGECSWVVATTTSTMDFREAIMSPITVGGTTTYKLLTYSTPGLPAGSFRKVDPNGIMQTGVDMLSSNDVIGVIGDSDTTNPHLHINRIKALYSAPCGTASYPDMFNYYANGDFVNSTYCLGCTSVTDTGEDYFLNPLGAISHTGVKTYDVKIKHRGGFNDVDKFPDGISLNYDSDPTKSYQEFLVRPIFSGGGLLNKYSAAINYDHIKLFLESCPTCPVSSSSTIIEGVNYLSELKYGGRLSSSMDYPQYTNMTIWMLPGHDPRGRFEISTHDRKSGIFPLAYRDSNKKHEPFYTTQGPRPFDDFYFCDVNFRVDKSHIAGVSALTSDTPLNVKYQDGEYKMKASVETVKSALSTSGSYEFTLDNFWPFITNLEIYNGATSVYEINRTISEGNASTFNDGTIESNVENFNPFPPISNDYQFQITFSESISSASIIYNGVSYLGTKIADLLWLFSPVPLSGDCPIISVIAEDEAGNPIMNVNNLFPLNSSNTLLIPTRINNGTSPSNWVNLPSSASLGKEDFTICLSVCNAGMIHDGEKPEITLRSSMEECLLADFTFSAIGCSAVFQNNSIGNATQYFWQFGDGGTSVEENPTHVYQDDGFYNVTLEISDGIETSTYALTIEISNCTDSDGNGGYIESCLISGPSLGAPEQTLTFNVQGFGLPPFTYEWSSFLDITEINDQTIQVTLPSGNDNYIIECEVSDLFGNSTFCEHTITVSGTIPELDLYMFPNPEDNILCLSAIYDVFNGSANEDYNFSYTNAQGEFWSQNFGGDYDLCFGGSDGNDPPELEPGVYDFCVTMSVSGVTDCLTGVVWGDYNPPPEPDDCINAPVKIEFIEADNDGLIAPGESLNFQLSGGFPNSQCVVCEENGNYVCKYLTVFEIYKFVDGDYIAYDSVPEANCWDPYTSIDNYENLFNCIQDISPSSIDLHSQTDTPLPFYGLQSTGCAEDLGTYLIQPYIYAFRCDPSYNLLPTQGAPSVPCPIEFTYTANSPEIVDFEINKCGEVTADITSGCRIEENNNLCFGKQYYKNYVWRAYRYDNSESEIEGILLNSEGYECTEFVKSNPYYAEFSGETFALHLELTCEDGNGITAYKKQLIVSEKPLHFLVPEIIERCKEGTSTFVLGESIVSGGRSPYEISYEGFEEWKNNPNPEFVSEDLNGKTIRINVIDKNECEIDLNVTVKTNELKIDITQPVILACENSSSSQTMFVNENVVLGGSGEFNYSWSSDHPNGLEYLSDPNEINPFVYAPTTITYTLQVDDLLSECYASGNVTVKPSNTQINARPSFSSPIDKCFSHEFVLGVDFGDGPYEIQNPTGEEILIEWSSNNPLFEDTSEPFPILSSYVNSVPGSYTYNLKVTDTGNGCYDEELVTYNIQKPLLSEGFIPVDQYIIPGISPVEAWSGPHTNRIILESENNLSSAISPLNVDWLDYTGNSSQLGDLYSDVNFEIYPTEAKQYELQLGNSISLGGGIGCSTTLKTDNFIFLEDLSPSLNIEILNESILICQGEEVCFNATLDLGLYSTPTSLPQTLLFDCTFNYLNTNNCQSINETIELVLVDGLQGIYKADFCWDTNENCDDNLNYTNMELVLESSTPFALSSSVVFILAKDVNEFGGCRHFCNSNVDLSSFGSGLWYTGDLIFAGVSDAIDCFECSDPLTWPITSHLTTARGTSPGWVWYGNGFTADSGANLFSFNMLQNVCGNNLTEELHEIRSSDSLVVDTVKIFPEFEIRPNPTDGIFTLEMKNIFSDTKIHLINTLGVPLLTYSLPTDSKMLEIDITKYLDGIYYILVVSDEGKIKRSIKIIKIDN